MKSGDHAGPLSAHMTWACYVLVCLGSSQLNWVKSKRSKYHLTQTCKLACMHAMCLHARAHISAKLKWIREIKVSMEPGEQARLFWAYISPWAYNQSCMHPKCLRAQAHISAKLGQIREIKVSMESGEHAGHLWAHHLTQACKLAYMHTVCLHAQAYISAKLAQIREIKVSMESGEHDWPLWADNFTQVHKLACMHAMCLHAHCTGPYLSQIGLNQRCQSIYGIRENMLDLSEYTSQPKHTS